MKPTSGRLFARLIRLGRTDDAEFLANIVKARNAVANDNVPITEGMGVDSEMVMRPTIEEVRRAAIPVKDGKPDPEGTIGLRFDAKGRLTEYRAAAEDGTPLLNKEGEEFWLRPKDGYKKPKGSRRKTSRARYLDSKRMREWLGADADVLDMAVEPHTTLHDIGTHIGAEGDEAAVSDAGEQEVRDVAKVFYDEAA